MRALLRRREPRGHLPRLAVNRHLDRRIGEEVLEPRGVVRSAAVRGDKDDRVTLSKNVSGTVRRFPLLLPTVVSKSTGMPAMRFPTRPPLAE